MMLRRRYTVPEDAYLFPGKVRPATEKMRNLEEPVRQWCAHELLRTYGIPVANLEFERSVSVGSKRYKIDILVKREGEPWIVAECKQPGDAKPADSLAQAKSYAGAADVQAEWVIATNGDYWQVARKVGAHWCPVPDLMSWERQEVVGEAVVYLRALNQIRPLLRLLENDRIEVKSHDFFDHLNGLFSLLHNHGFASAHLLAGSGIAVRPFVGEFHISYRVGKLIAAANQFTRYRSGMGLEGEFPPITASGSFSEELHTMLVGIDQLTYVNSVAESHDRIIVSLLRVALAWGYDLEMVQQTKVPMAVHPCLRDVLDAYLKFAFGVSLPGPSDSMGMQDLWESCRNVEGA